jgi:hypothetical protein
MQVVRLYVCIHVDVRMYMCVYMSMAVSNSLYIRGCAYISVRDHEGKTREVNVTM